MIFYIQTNLRTFDFEVFMLPKAKAKKGTKAKYILFSPYSNKFSDFSFFDTFSRCTKSESIRFLKLEKKRKGGVQNGKNDEFSNSLENIFANDIWIIVAQVKQQ